MKADTLLNITTTSPLQQYGITGEGVSSVVVGYTLHTGQCISVEGGSFPTPGMGRQSFAARSLLFTPVI